jgi:soluble lytic murein transglycosylase-like protein
MWSSNPLMYTGRLFLTRTQKRNILIILRTFYKTILFAIIFVLCFHLPNSFSDFKWGFKTRDQKIREIAEVLGKQPSDLAEVTREELAEVIYEEADRNSQDPKFILALISIESSFYNWAVSEKGAKGLMQIMPPTGELLAKKLRIEWSGDRTLFNPYLNIKMGSYYLAQLIKQFNDPQLALEAYNYGPDYIQNLKDNKGEIPVQYYKRFQDVYHNL